MDKEQEKGGKADVKMLETERKNARWNQHPKPFRLSYTCF